MMESFATAAARELGLEEACMAGMQGGHGGRELPYAGLVEEDWQVMRAAEELFCWYASWLEEGVPMADTWDLATRYRKYAMQMRAIGQEMQRLQQENDGLWHTIQRAHGALTNEQTLDILECALAEGVS